MELKLEEDEEDFRSCADDEDLKEMGECASQGPKKSDVDENSIRMLFKGVSVVEPGDPGYGFSGIGVVMDAFNKVLVSQVQKKLDFYVDEIVSDYLALMDGLSDALRTNFKRVFAYTCSKTLFNQITDKEIVENPLLMALKHKILELAGKLEYFVLKLVPDIDLESPLRLAQLAIGIVSVAAKENAVELCSICCKEKLACMTIAMKCSHKFCSHCMIAHVDKKVESSQVPIRCPFVDCRYYISLAEFKSFLPVTSYELLERSFAESKVLSSDKLHCPFPNCSALLDPLECLSSTVNSSTQPDNNCLECPVCQRFICMHCWVPWHSSLSCEEYQDLPLEARDAGEITLHCLNEHRRWRRCVQCRRMVELNHGCYHLTCWCGHEFCFSCGAEYIDGQQTCQCAFWDEESSATLPAQQFEQWAWDSFGSLSMMMDAYSDQERSQLALIQRFLAGGFSLSDHHPHQSPPPCVDSYGDTMKDLHQLPWLERFVSVISDNFYDEYNTQ